MPRGMAGEGRVLEASSSRGSTRRPGPAAIPWTSSSALDVLHLPPIRRSSPEQHLYTELGSGRALTRDADDFRDSYPDNSAGSVAQATVLLLDGTSCGEMLAPETQER
jgi:hypothetical protein